MIKAGSRVLINTSPEPFTNWAASFTEDLAVIGGLWLALHSPLLFLFLFFLFLLLAIWLIPKIWAAIVIVARKLGAFFSGSSQDPVSTNGPQQPAQSDPVSPPAASILSGATAPPDPPV